MAKIGSQHRRGRKVGKKIVPRCWIAPKTINGALLFVHHASDGCEVTPYGDAAQLSERYPLITVLGGASPQSGPCEAFSQHGFIGKEPETVEQIVNWMLKGRSARK